MFAEPPVHIDYTHQAVIIEICHHGTGDVPFFPTGKLAQAGFADIEEGVMLAAGEGRYGYIAEVWDIGWSVELTDKCDAGTPGAFGADK
ncbi:MAG: hypothetical protein WBQ95_20010, partial [Terracidiphilus sp.]